MGDPDRKSRPTEMSDDRILSRSGASRRPRLRRVQVARLGEVVADPDLDDAVNVEPNSVTTARGSRTTSEQRRAPRGPATGSPPAPRGTGDRVTSAAGTGQLLQADRARWPGTASPRRLARTSRRHPGVIQPVRVEQTAAGAVLPSECRERLTVASQSGPCGLTGDHPRRGPAGAKLCLRQAAVSIAGRALRCI